MRIAATYEHDLGAMRDACTDAWRRAEFRYHECEGNDENECDKIARNIQP